MPKCPKCGAMLSALDENRYACPNCHATFKRNKRAQETAAQESQPAYAAAQEKQAGSSPATERQNAVQAAGQAYAQVGEQANATQAAEASPQPANQQPAHQKAAYEQREPQQSAYEQAAFQQSANEQAAHGRSKEERQAYELSAAYDLHAEETPDRAYGQAAPQQAAQGLREWEPVPEGTLPCLKIEGLSKKYPQASRYAVKDLSLVCYPGEIVGLLGHNGAGKSTTLKCLTGMLPFEEGKIEINGFDIKHSPVKAKYTFGFVSDKHDVFVKMTGVQYLNFMADAYGVSKKDRQERLVELDEVFALGDRLRDPINSYSHGMRQKICMLGSLIHYPKLWIMDEPMIGLDPVTSARVSAFMLEYAARGNCILFSSHNIGSVQKLCKRAVIINHGNKTDDFEFADFIRMNPDINLEEYFLYRTEGVQEEDGNSEVAQ